MLIFFDGIGRNEVVKKGYFVFDNENSWYGDSQCGKNWTAYAPQEYVEAIIHNPHSFGNETAIDEMLSSMALTPGIEFDKGILDSGATERNVGLFFVMVSVMLLGIALFSTLIHIRNSKIIWVLGSLSLFAFSINEAWTLLKSGNEQKKSDGKKMLSDLFKDIKLLLAYHKTIYFSKILNTREC